MPAKNKLPALNEIKNGIKITYKALQQSLKKIKLLGEKKGNAPIINSIAKEQKQQLSNLKLLLKATDELKKELKREIKRETILLQNKIKKLEQLQDAMQANTYLLEYKRKDLLLQSQELETSNENIRNQNNELHAHQQRIAAQVEELRKVHNELEERNSEMEEKTEALLDQTDYLYEANEIITNMHRELEKQKDEIVNKNQELLLFNEEKNNLIGIVAHDLKSPLHQIKGLVSIVKVTAMAVDNEAINCLNLIENSTNRMSNMISKILDIEAIESQQLNLNMKKINVTEYVKSIIERFKPEAENKNIQLHYSPSPSLHIEADASYINQIIENLLSNAIKFSPQEKNIFISETEKDNYVLIMVKDEGPGLTTEDKKKLFNKYQKLSARPTGNESSTGLGLSIVKKFVEAMQGKIWCESEQGEGATFIVEFKKV